MATVAKFVSLGFHAAVAKVEMSGLPKGSIPSPLVSTGEKRSCELNFEILQTGYHFYRSLLQLLSGSESVS